MVKLLGILFSNSFINLYVIIMPIFYISWVYFCRAWTNIATKN
jgi:hypothetical protein